jgi:CO dehydrogenase maturation factor
LRKNFSDGIKGMAITIALSGKGGSGKTTLAAMIIRVLAEQSSKPVLAVDADPNSCLGATLGVEATDDVAQIREKCRSKEPTSEGTDRLRTLEYDLQTVITEGKGFDLLTMGRPEGPSCYCAVNNMLRNFLDKLSSSYGFVVLDNEAGMEHLSRRTTNNVDLLCIVAEATPIGLLTAQRIFELAGRLPISVNQCGIIWNRTKSPGELEQIDSLGCVPYDKAVLEASMEGKTIFDIQINSPAIKAVKKILEEKLNLKKIKMES